MTKDFPTNEVEQIDALLHLNANGSLTSPVPGLAIELLKKYRAHLSEAAQRHSLYSNRESSITPRNAAQPPLENLVREYARDLRKSSSGEDDLPATADYLETLIERAHTFNDAQPEKVSKDALAVATYIEELTTPRMIDLLLDRNDREIVIAALKTYAAQPPAAPVETEEDWREDPSSDERWNAGLDYGMVRFCACLGVDPKDVRWDAATEELDGDVCAVIGNILRVKFGENFDPDSVCRSSAGSEPATWQVRFPRESGWSEWQAVVQNWDGSRNPSWQYRPLYTDAPQAAQVPVDQVARTIALSYGRDPDEMTEWTEMCDADNRPVPVWRVYEEQAEALFAAYSITREHS